MSVVVLARLVSFVDENVVIEFTISKVVEVKDDKTYGKRPLNCLKQLLGKLTDWYLDIIESIFDTTVFKTTIFASMDFISVGEQDSTDSLIIAVDELTIVEPLPFRLEFWRIYIVNEYEYEHFSDK